MVNSEFSEKSNSDKHGLHTTQSTMLPQDSFCREAELIYAILLRKHFLEVIWKYIAKRFVKLLCFADYYS